MTPTVALAVRELEAIAPPALAEEWDNVGLLAGDPDAPLRKVLTCLTLTPDVVQEAVRDGVGLVVTHHPLPFRGVKSLAIGTLDGGSLWRLARAGVAVYSPHTAYDSAPGGINDQWAAALGLTDVVPLLPAAGRDDGAGAGRVGSWPQAGRFDLLAEEVRRAANPRALRVVVPPEDASARVAIACGSGGALLDASLAAGCGVFLTGELGFHDCLRCRSSGTGLILVGHYASERFAVESLARRLAARLPGVEVAASRVEQDPLSAA